MDTAATGLDILAELNWFDVGVCAMLLIGLVVGLFRGFFSQIAGIVGVVGSLVLALELSPHAYQLGMERFPDVTTSVGMIGAFAAVFLATWTLWLILTHFGKRLLSRMELGAFDRVLGGAFGLAKGSLVAYILLVLIARFTPAEWSVSHEFESSHANQGVEFVDTILKDQRTNIPASAWDVISELRGFPADEPEARGSYRIRFEADDRS